MLFKHGQIVATPGALSLEEQGVSLLTYLHRHLCGDWGDLDEHDRDENDISVDNYVESLPLWGSGKWDLDGRIRFSHN